MINHNNSIDVCAPSAITLPCTVFVSRVCRSIRRQTESSKYQTPSLYTSSFQASQSRYTSAHAGHETKKKKNKDQIVINQSNEHRIVDTN